MRDLEIVAAVALVVVNIAVPSLPRGFARSREDLKEEVRSCPSPFPVAGSGRGEGGVGVELEGREVAVDAAFDGVEFGVGSRLDDAALVDDEDAVGVADGGKDGAVTGICLRLLTVLRQAFLWSSRGLGIDSDSDPDAEGFPQGRRGAGKTGRGCRCCKAPPRSLRALADSRELPFVLARLRAKPRGRDAAYPCPRGGGDDRGGVRGLAGGQLPEDVKPPREAARNARGAAGWFAARNAKGRRIGRA